DAWTGLIFLLIVAVFFGAVIWSAVDSYEQSKQNCEYDANVLDVVSRYKGGCQFATEQGIWLDQQDYLMLMASSCK
ncbi:hypothetical protein MUP59_00620, partial [Candidatus Bathyarchaeota archaeon]|nr:hypothetical protein [Candidatus Bathyarchaeota archaeon]